MQSCTEQNVGAKVYKTHVDGGLHQAGKGLVRDMNNEIARDCTSIIDNEVSKALTEARQIGEGLRDSMSLNLSNFI